MATADAETYDRTNVDVTFERLRDDVLHEANRLKAEVATLTILLERERQLRRRSPWSWLETFAEVLADQLGHQNHSSPYAIEYIGTRR